MGGVRKEPQGLFTAALPAAAAALRERERRAPGAAAAGAPAQGLRATGAAGTRGQPATHLCRLPSVRKSQTAQDASRWPEATVLRARTRHRRRRERR